jgi:hypothetical protein
MQSNRVLGAVVVLAIGAACSPGSTTNDANTSGNDASTTANDAYVPHDSGPWQGDCITLQYPSITVPASGTGQEDTQCVVVDLGNDLPMHVHSIHNLLGDASHHFIVYRASPTETLSSTPSHCQPFVDTLRANAGSPLMISQRRDDLLTLPDGVAYTLQPHQPIRLELHYINLTGAPVTTAPTAQLCPIPDSQFTDEADFLFIGDPDVSLPPHQSTTLGPIFYPLDPQFANAHFFAITGHTHSLGTNVIVQTGPGAAGPFADVYNVPGWLWSEPQTVTAPTPFMLPSGGGFNFTCEWNNTTDSTVNFGESATNEMCFFWAYYYPAHPNAPHVCFHTNRTGGAAGYNLCCPSPNAVCNLIASHFTPDAGPVDAGP